MTLTDARKILGLGPDEDPRPHLAEFRAARERIAEMVRTAPNETLGDRYQAGLIEFDQALAAVREYLEALGLATPPETAAASAPAVPEPPDAATPESPRDPQPPAAAPRRRSLAAFTGLLVLVTAVIGGGLIHFKNEEHQETQRQLRLKLLERLGSEFIENRRWQDATTTFAEIEALAPHTELAKLGRRSIEAGIAEEQNQFVGYWTGQAIAELEAGRLDEADAAIRRVSEKFPADPQAAAISARIATARDNQSRNAALAAARRHVR